MAQLGKIVELEADAPHSESIELASLREPVEPAPASMDELEAPLPLADWRTLGALPEVQGVEANEADIAELPELEVLMASQPPPPTVSEATDPALRLESPDSVESFVSSPGIASPTAEFELEEALTWVKREGDAEAAPAPASHHQPTMKPPHEAETDDWEPAQPEVYQPKIAMGKASKFVSAMRTFAPATFESLLASSLSLRFLADETDSSSDHPGA
jgi:hypothetical protein